MTDLMNNRQSGKTITAFTKHVVRRRLIIFALTIATFTLAVLAVNAGAANTSPLQVLRALLGIETGTSSIVVWNIRLPRVIAGIVAGAGLGIAGCVMQTNLKNPLASPSTLGISNAAAFGANLAIILFGAGSVQSNTHDAVFINNPYIVTVTAFAFSILAMIMILLLARLRGFSPESVVLAGVAFGSLFTAGSTLLQYFAEDVQVAAMVFWTFGDLGRISWHEVAILTAVVLVAFIYFQFHRWDYNTLDTSVDTAKSLGVQVEKVRFGALLAASMISAVAVSFMGIIGFVGLIAPQMMRRILGVDHRFLIPASAICGSALLLFSDTLARTMISPVILPVGAITSFFGAPLFLFLLAKGYTKR